MSAVAGVALHVFEDSVAEPLDAAPGMSDEALLQALEAVDRDGVGAAHRQPLLGVPFDEPEQGAQHLAEHGPQVGAGVGLAQGAHAARVELADDDAKAQATIVRSTRRLIGRARRTNEEPRGDSSAGFFT